MQRGGLNRRTAWKLAEAVLARHCATTDDSGFSFYRAEKLEGKMSSPKDGFRKQEVPSKWAASWWTTVTCGGRTGRRRIRCIRALFKPKGYSGSSSTSIPAST